MWLMVMSQVNVRHCLRVRQMMICGGGGARRWWRQATVKGPRPGAPEGVAVPDAPDPPFLSGYVGRAALVGADRNDGDVCGTKGSDTVLSAPASPPCLRRTSETVLVIGCSGVHGGEDDQLHGVLLPRRSGNEGTPSGGRCLGDELLPIGNRSLGHNHQMDGAVLEEEDVRAFLSDLHAMPAEGLERLSGGEWSSAWAYRARGEELVVRFGRDGSWYEADRMASALVGPDLPVPEVREVGRTPSGLAYAVSVRHRGQFLEETPVDRAGALSATLARLLVALHDVPARPGFQVVWHQPSSPLLTWRAFLLAGLVDDPDEPVHGWSAELEADRELSALAGAVTARARVLVDACPERRDLVHGDLLHRNVLVSPDASKVEAVFSWKCSVRGDFLFDAAWCTFWSSFHPGIAAADPLRGVLTAPSIKADRGALVDAAARHHCYELHIGFTHLGWNLWTGNRAALSQTAERLAEVFERGPLDLRTV